MATGELPAERLDVVPLLKSYRSALVLARRPPQSLAVPPKLWTLLRRLRPTWGSHYYATRYVRRRTAAVERALAARCAVGEADENDKTEADALKQFQSSLTPPPPRLVMALAFIAAILLSQALVNVLFSSLDSFIGEHREEVSNALAGLNLSPDVKSLGDVIDALAAANFIEIGFVIAAVAFVAYVFGRPLASGYRLAYYCTGRPERLGRLRRHSPLRMQACALEIPEQEAAVARITEADLRREAPMDLVVKATLWFAAAYWLVGLLRFDGSPHVEAGGFVLWLAICGAAVAGIGWLSRRARGRWVALAWVAAIVVAVALIPVLVHKMDSESAQQDTVWLVLFGLTVARLGWLARKAHSRRASRWWLLAPLATVVLIALVASYNPNEVSADATRVDALKRIHAVDVPRLSRSDLKLMLLSDPKLAGVDLRGQDLHGFVLVGKRLPGAILDVADLRDGILNQAHLRNASLAGTLLTRAFLVGADLRGADLECADLRGANLQDAKLDGTVLSGALGSESTTWPDGFDPSAQGVQPESALDETEMSGRAAVYGYIAYFCEP
jgi:pentapeptide repeat protein